MLFIEIKLSESRTRGVIVLGIKGKLVRQPSDIYIKHEIGCMDD